MRKFLAKKNDEKTVLETLDSCTRGGDMVALLETIKSVEGFSAPFISAGIIQQNELKSLFTLAKKSLAECPSEPLCLITRKQAAEILRISARGLDRLIRQGVIPFVRVGKRSVRLDQRRIEKYIEKNTGCNLIPAGEKVK